MLFAITIYDKPNSGAARDAHRQAHLDYLESFEAETRFAGPILTEDLKTELGSIRLIDLPDRAAAERNVAEEPYIIGGAQEGGAIYRWAAGTPHTWRDCPRREGNVQFLISALDRDGGAALRAELRDRHEAYQAEIAESCIARGALLSDDGDREIGFLIVLDVADAAAARDLWDREPYNAAGLFGEVAFYGWRFGRVFDRFKVAV